MSGFLLNIVVDYEMLLETNQEACYGNIHFKILILCRRYCPLELCSKFTHAGKNNKISQIAKYTGLNSKSDERMLVDDETLDENGKFVYWMQH